MTNYHKSNVINGDLFTDDRGTISFINDFNPTNCGVKRFYTIKDHSIGKIRAWHGHVKEAKYVYVPSGTALIGIVPMEYISETDQYILHKDKVEKHILSSTKPKILYIPPLYANGFKSLEQGTIITFYSTSSLEESKNDDIRFNWLDVDIWGENHR